MQRLLCIVGAMNLGGAETFLMKIYREIDKTKYQLDFAVSIKENGIYDNEIKSLGGKIYHITKKTRNPIKHLITIHKIVKKKGYKSVIIISQNSVSALDLLAAKTGGAEILAFRSSNSNSCGSKMVDMIHLLFKPLVKKLPNVRIAPSNKAGDFVFGKDNYRILKNGLKLENYKFSEKERNKIRGLLDINDKFVVGHIGRFSYQKNHKFLIEIFSELKKEKHGAILLLIGIGELEGYIKEQVKLMNLNDSVKFLGLRYDIPFLLMGMDVLLFPSYFEGMPNVVIEAQATGLPCVISDTITQDANITGNVKYLSLNANAKEWVKYILDTYKNVKDRLSDNNLLKNNNYSIEEIVKEFESMLFYS